MPHTKSAERADTGLLYRLLRDATGETQLERVFEILFRGGREGLGAREGAVLQFNPELDAFEIRSKTSGVLRTEPELLSVMRPQIRRLAGLSENLVRSEPEAMFFVGSKSQVAVPIPVGSHASGVLVLETDGELTLDRAQIDFLRELTGQTSNVIRAFGRIESSRRTVAALWDLGLEMSSPSELDIAEMNTLLGKILQVALTRTRTTNGIILMAGESNDELVTHSKAVMGDVTYQVPRILHRRRDGRAPGIVFAVLDTNQPYRSADIRNEPDYLPLFRGIVSHLSVPISFQDRCIGVIAVESPEPNAFTDDDQRVLEDLSRSIVILVRRAQLYEATRDKRGRHGILIRGLSPEWEEVERRVERAAATNATVILRGESGTGKELVANAVHFNSKRCRRPLVTVNSAAIPEALLESTLFGHVKGAFTGASYDRVGAFEQANGGTIFLDEIGDLSLPLQAKLLRVLQTGEIEKVGANEHSTRVDVRVIAATSRDLETMMADNEFREDLYYRLHVVPIRLPPLRRYKQSIPNMVKAFIAEAGIEHGRPGVEIETAALEALLRWDFPGNVRELKNMIERAVILCRNNVITLDDLPSQVASHQGSGGATLASTHDYRTLKQHMLDRFERTYLEDLMRAAHGNISRAAELSGLSRVHCYKLLKRYDVDVSGFRE